jgi:predicted lipoprotein with Yx(FWY)xxD motif
MLSRIPAAIGAAVLGAVLGAVLAACGGSSGGSTTGTSNTGSSNSSSKVTIGLGTTSSGSVLVNDRGRTLYEFTADTPTGSGCNGPCVSVWAPVTIGSGQPQAGTGVTGALGVLTRSDGTKQVTIAGHPLYTYTGDTATGQANGQKITSYGGTWYVVAATGAGILGSGGGSSPTASPSSGDGGYHY